MPEGVTFVGLPGAGKTTFYRRYFATTHRHISKDLWPNARGREARQEKVLADRAAIIGIARRFDVRVIGYFFDVTAREAVARNATRTGGDQLPKVAIFTTAKRLESPTMAEGFNQLFRLRRAADRTFGVTEIE